MSEKLTYSFEKLMEICCNPSDRLHNIAWHELITRYKPTVYKNVYFTCKRWNIPRIHMQLNDIVNDVVAEVFQILVKHLKDFRETTNENKFLGWLAVICIRASGRYIRKTFYLNLSENELNEGQEFFGQLDNDQRWALYESIVQVLKENFGEKKRHSERDINIFLLYTWADFSTNLIYQHPCYKDLGHRVADVVVNRLRNILKENSHQFENY